MEKLKQESADLTEQNIDKIAALFPNVITETKDADGKLKRAINFTLLQQMLQGDLVEGDECYEFTWVGKKQSIIEGNKPIRKTLRPCPEESKDWEKTENLYIEGDNLEVLKLLQGSYFGGIKMMYFDPPYNTGNDYVYRDNFAATKDDYEDDLGMYDENENRLFINSESNGRFHSDWCSMMYPRLQLARNLLTDDGVIFISIDDNEVHNLRKLCDEIFGEANFIADIIWEGNGKNDSKYISIAHENILFYAKNKIYLTEKQITFRSIKEGINEIYETVLNLNEKCNGDFQKASEELKYWYNQLNKNHPSWQHRHYNKIDSKGVFFPGDISAESGRGREPYDVFHPITGKKCKSPERGFPTKKTMEEWIFLDLVDFGEDENCVPKRKRYLKDTDSYVLPSVIYKDSRSAYKNMINLMGDKVFDNPKDVSIIKKYIGVCTKEHDIVLDIFSGSSTTAHAVMQLNAEDGGNRKFIMVQLPEACDEKGEAYKAGYKNICEIGKERIRRAGKKIEEELKSKSNKGELFVEETKTIDTGFRVLKLDSTNMKDVYYGAGDYTQQMLLDLESNIKNDRTDLDLLYGVLLDWGVSLQLPHTTETIGGVKVHFVNDTDLVACFAEKVNESVIREIAKRKPLRVVFRDSSFANSPDKINVTEIFKTISPETTVKVI